MQERQFYDIAGNEAGNNFSNTKVGVLRTRCLDRISRAPSTVLKAYSYGNSS